MARPKSMPIRKMLSTMFGGCFLRRLARESGAVVRERKVDVMALFWTLVLGFGLGKDRSIAGLRRSYEKTTGETLAPSSFYKRFSPGLARMLKGAAAHALDSCVQMAGSLRGPLSQFKDVLLTDSTVIRLHDLLARAFAACRTNHTKAALKMHAVLSVRGAGNNSVKVTSERAHDGPVFRVGPWVRDRLLLFDLGYFRHQLFDSIMRNQGHFISRLKASSNPTIVEVFRATGMRKEDLVGRKLKDVLPRLRGEILDVKVEVKFHRKLYRQRRAPANLTLRVVGIPDSDTGEFHLYITSIALDKLSAEQVATTYRARWTIELMFKELKTHYRIDDMPSASRPVVEALLYASVITFIVSKRLQHAVRKKLATMEHRIRDQRWAAVFASLAQEILLLMVRPPRDTGLIARLATETILREAVDPNAKRLGLLQTIETRHAA